MEERRVEPIEITKEKAFVAYILTGNRSASSRLCGVNVDVIKHWIEVEDWETSRQEYYDEVHKYTSDFLREDLAVKQAEMATKALEWLDDMMLTNLQDAEGGSKLDLWKAFETGVNAVEKLLGMTSSDKKNHEERQPLIQLSGEGQKIYLQAIQKLGIIDERDTENLREHSQLRFTDGRKAKNTSKCQKSLSSINQSDGEK